MKRYYAGIGSRETPSSVLEQMTRIGSYMGKRSYILRSGHAMGADRAFEEGCDIVNGEKEIWHPDGAYYPLHDWATDMASGVCWEYPLEKMRGYSIKLITRNMYQIFGEDNKEDERVDFVVYWCRGDVMEKGSKSGGTRYGVRIAKEYGIPTYNLRTESKEFADFIRTLR